MRKMRNKFSVVIVLAAMMLAYYGCSSESDATGSDNPGAASPKQTESETTDLLPADSIKQEMEPSPESNNKDEASSLEEDAQPSSAPGAAIATAAPAPTPAPASVPTPTSIPESTPTPTPAPEPEPSGISFPYNFSATDIYGNTVTDATLGEKEVFFVHLWATWCPPCVAEMPDFASLVKTYGDKVGFLALLIDYDNALDEAVNIVESAGIPSSFYMVDAYNQSVSSILSLLESGYVPTTVLFSAGGTGEQIIGAYGSGYSSFIDELLS